MITKYVWLSFPLAVDGPLPPGIPPPEITPLYSVTRDGANVYVLKVANHSGTHVDTPKHVFDNGVSIIDFAPEELTFTKPVVMELTFEAGGIVMPEHLYPQKELSKADIVLFRFGTSELRRLYPERFASQSPGFSVEAARWLRTNCPNLRAVGLDLPSIVCIPRLEETKGSHHELLGGEGRRFLIIEDMNLAHDLGGLREVRLCPWLVHGTDSGPCSVIGVIKV